MKSYVYQNDYNKSRPCSCGKKMYLSISMSGCLKKRFPVKLASIWMLFALVYILPHCHKFNPSQQTCFFLPGFKLWVFNIILWLIILWFAITISEGCENVESLIASIPCNQENLSNYSRILWQILFLMFNTELPAKKVNRCSITQKAPSKSHFLPIFYYLSGGFLIVTNV